MRSSKLSTGNSFFQIKKTSIKTSVSLIHLLADQRKAKASNFYKAISRWASSGDHTLPKNIHISNVIIRGTVVFNLSQRPLSSRYRYMFHITTINFLSFSHHSRLDRYRLKTVLSLAQVTNIVWYPQVT
jgi:hypothetical protein